MPEVKIRPVRLWQMRKEVDAILEVFNDAWSENWGFVPATSGEAKAMADDLRLIVDPAIALIVENCRRVSSPFAPRDFSS